MKNNGTPSVGPVLDFLRLLWQVDHGMATRSKRMLATLGVTAPQRMVVRMAGRFPGISAGELAEILHVDPGTLSSALRRLEAAGAIQRRADVKDRRRVRLHLTTKGKRLDQDLDDTVESAVKRVVQATPATTLRATERVLLALAEELGRVPAARRRKR